MAVVVAVVMVDASHRATEPAQLTMGPNRDERQPFTVNLLQSIDATHLVFSGFRAWDFLNRKNLCGGSASGTREHFCMAT